MDMMIFIKSAQAGDGSKKRNSNTYWTTSLQLRDDMQEMVMKCVNKDVSYGLKVLDVMTELGTTMSSSKSIPTSSFNSNNNSKNISSSNSNSGKNDKHSYNVLITWDNPNCGSCPFPRPSAQNGIVDYFNERAGSFSVIPVCPICGKKQYSTISGYTSNIGTSTQVSLEKVINCN